MSSPVKRVGQVLLAHQEITNPESVVGSALNVVKAIRGNVFLFHGFIEAAANTNPQKWLIQASGETSGNEDWITLQTVNITFIGTVKGEPLTATEPALETALAVADASEYAAGDGIYIHDTVAATDSEWGLVDKVDTTPAEFIHLADGLTTGKDATDDVYDNPQTNIVAVELEGINRIRVVYINEGATAADTAVKSTLTTLEKYEFL